MAEQRCRDLEAQHRASLQGKHANGQALDQLVENLAQARSEFAIHSILLLKFHVIYIDLLMERLSAKSVASIECSSVSIELSYKGT